MLLSEEENAKNDKFRELAKQSIGLLADAFARLQPAASRPLYPAMWLIYFRFIGVGGPARAGLATWDMALQMAENLDMLRRLVSSTCNSALPSITTLEYSMDPHVTDECQAVVLTMLENMFKVVKFDVEAITSTIAQAPLGMNMETRSPASPDASNDVDAAKEIDMENLKDLDEISDILGFANLPPLLLSEEEKAMQEKLLCVAERSISLMVDALTNLPPAYRRPLSPLYMGVMAMYPAIAKVAVFAKAGRAKLGMAVTLAIQLDDFRRLLLVLRNTPLPLMKDVHLVEIAATEGCEVALMALVENIYTTVESDVNAVLSAAA